MQYRRLPHTNTEVSAICMGCWQISTNRSDYWGTQEARESEDAIQAAIDAGINFFDTAEDYDEGNSEELLGKALGRRRQDVIVATKASPKHAAPQDLRNACEQSLRRLKTDWIDLYQLHFPSPDVALDDTLSEMIKLRTAGKIRAIGLSNFGVSYLKDVHDAAVIASNQLPYSLLWRAIEEKILPASLALGLGILCYSPLMQGLLTGKYRTPEQVPPGRQQTRLFSSRRPKAGHGESGCEEQVFAAIDRIDEICHAIGQPMSQVAIAWVMAQPGVTSVITGARNRQQITQNALAADALSPQVLADLTAATEEVKKAVGTNADMWMHESRMERQPAHAK